MLTSDLIHPLLRFQGRDFWVVLVDPPEATQQAKARAREYRRKRRTRSCERARA